MTDFIHINPKDNVVVAMDIPQGHKMTLKALSEGDQVVKYGFSIGHATESVGAGEWIHTHNMRTNLEGELEYTYTPNVHFPEKLEAPTFMGCRRKDGRAAIRNEIWIIPTVGCVNDVAKALARENQDRLHRRPLHLHPPLRLFPDRP